MHKNFKPEKKEEIFQTREIQKIKKKKIKFKIKPLLPANPAAATPRPTAINVRPCHQKQNIQLLAHWVRQVIRHSYLSNFTI